MRQERLAGNGIMPEEGKYLTFVELRMEGQYVKGSFEKVY